MYKLYSILLILKSFNNKYIFISLVVDKNIQKRKNLIKKYSLR